MAPLATEAELVAPVITGPAAAAGVPEVPSQPQPTEASETVPLADIVMSVPSAEPVAVTVAAAIPESGARLQNAETSVVQPGQPQEPSIVITPPSVPGAESVHAAVEVSGPAAVEVHTPLPAEPSSPSASPMAPTPPHSRSGAAWPTPPAGAFLPSSSPSAERSTEELPPLALPSPSPSSSPSHSTAPAADFAPPALSAVGGAGVSMDRWDLALGASVAAPGPEIQMMPLSPRTIEPETKQPHPEPHGHAHTQEQNKPLPAFVYLDTLLWERTK